MASGAWEWVGANSWSGARLEFSSKSNGSSANSSDVTVSLYARRIDGGTSWNDTSGNNFYVTIDGTRYGNSGGAKVSGTNWTLVKSATKTVSHNSDGSKTINISGGGSIGETTFNINSKSIDVTLDKIARYTSVTLWDIDDTDGDGIGQTYAKFKWATADTVDWVRVYLNDSNQHTDNPGSVNGKSGSFTYIGANASGASIPTNSTLKPGTTYNLKVEVRRKDSQLWTKSANKTFTTIPIASIANTSVDFTIGSNLTLSIDNYMNNLYYLAMDIKDENGNWETDVIRTNETLNVSSYEWALSSYESTLYAKVQTRSSADIKIRCGTTIDGQVYENYILGVMSIANSNPTFSNFTYGNNDSDTKSVLGDSSYLVQGYGAMQANISTDNKAVAKNNATVVKYVGYVTDSNGNTKKTLNLSWSDTSQVSFNFGSFSESGTYKINIYAVDSRGLNSQTVSKEFYVIPYHHPQTKITMDRMNGYEKEIIINFSSVCSGLVINGTQKNTKFTVQYRYCAVGSSSWSDYISLSGFSSTPNGDDMTKSLSIPNDSSQYLTQLDETKAYNFEFRIIDSIIGRIETAYVAEGVPIMVESSDGHIGIGMVPEWDNQSKLQVASDIAATDSNGNLVNILEKINNVENDYNNKDTQISNAVSNLENKVVSQIINVSSVNNLKFACGTKVISVNSSATSALVFTFSKLNQIFGATDCGNENTIVFLSNGDGGTDDAHVDGATCLPREEAWYATFDRSTTGNIRVNYLIVYFGDTSSLTTTTAIENGDEVSY